MKYVQKKYLQVLKYLQALIICALTFFGGAKVYAGPFWEQRMEKELESTGKSLAKENQIDLLLACSGILDVAHSQGVGFALSFVDHRRMTIEEVRPIIAVIFKTLLDKATNHSAFLEYLKQTDTHVHNPTPPLPERIGIKLAFWDAKNDRYLNPALAQVRVADGKVFYYYADPKTQALTDPVVQTIPELLEMTSAKVNK